MAIFLYSVISHLLVIFMIVSILNYEFNVLYLLLFSFVDSSIAFPGDCLDVFVVHVSLWHVSVE
jgi:hypothetical protein